MDAALKAIANDKRREILQLVWSTELSSSEIAERTSLSRPAASQHLRVLRDADLIAVRVDANRRLYAARQERLDELRAFLEDFWAGRLALLKAAAEEHGGRHER